MINLWVKAIYIVLNPCNCVYEKDIMINTYITYSFGLLGNISLKWQRATIKVYWFLGFVGHVSLMMIIRPIYKVHVVKRYVFI